jgi:hypothetical protein
MYLIKARTAAASWIAGPPGASSAFSSIIHPSQEHWIFSMAFARMRAGMSHHEDAAAVRAGCLRREP